MLLCGEQNMNHFFVCVIIMIVVESHGYLLHKHTYIINMREKKCMHIKLYTSLNLSQCNLLTWLMHF